MTGDPVLTVTDLRLGLQGAKETLLVDGVSFTLRQGQTLALVGESGSGKSLTALSLMRLLPDPPVKILSGRIELDGRDLTVLHERELAQLRGGALSMIFQEPLSALNPVMTIGRQLLEAVRAHEKLDRREARRRVLDLLDLVHMPDAARRIDEYPHRLSGGMRQRALIAMAMAGRPRVLIADEPTTALDATVQAEILETLNDLKRDFGVAILLITHDLGLVADYADEVAVMYAGRIVESGPVDAVLSEPAHPYTVGLLGARPTAHAYGLPKELRPRLADIPGTVPSPDRLPAGCAFQPRCSRAVDSCAQISPAIVPVAAHHEAACLRLEAA